MPHQKARTSRLAQTGFLLSLPVCVPIVPAMTSIVLSVAALFRIRRSRGLLKGRVYAIIGCVLSFLTLGLTCDHSSQCLGAYSELSPIADAVLKAAGDGEIAAAGDHLAEDFSFNMSDAQYGDYEGKRWARVFSVNTLADPLKATVCYYASFSNCEKDQPVRFVFISNNGTWKALELTM